MKVDEISTYIKTDSLIIRFGNKLCNKHMNNDDQSKYISNKLRELSRFTLEMRKSCETVTNLDNAINPEYFSVLVDCVICC